MGEVQQDMARGRHTLVPRLLAGDTHLRPKPDGKASFCEAAPYRRGVCGWLTVSSIQVHVPLAWLVLTLFGALLTWAQRVWVAELHHKPVHEPFDVSINRDPWRLPREQIALRLAVPHALSFRADIQLELADRVIEDSRHATRLRDPP